MKRWQLCLRTISNAGLGIHLNTLAEQMNGWYDRTDYCNWTSRANSYRDRGSTSSFKHASRKAGFQLVSSSSEERVGKCLEYEGLAFGCSSYHANYLLPSTQHSLVPVIPANICIDLCVRTRGRVNRPVENPVWCDVKLTASRTTLSMLSISRTTPVGSRDLPCGRNRSSPLRILSWTEENLVLGLLVRATFRNLPIRFCLLEHQELWNGFNALTSISINGLNASCGSGIE